MATEREEIIYSIKLDIEATNTALKEYGANLADISKAQKDITAGTKEQVEMAEREEKAKKKTIEAIKAEEGSIKALREENKKLTAERNNTSLATDEGRKRVAQLNRELDENNKIIKDNVDAYTKQKIGIGDYSGALDKLIPGLGATTNGLKATGKEMWALVSNPLGATLAVLGLAFGALMKYFKGSEEGQNQLNKIMLIGSTIMEKIWDVVENVGEAIYNAFTNPKQALLDLVDLIKTNLVNRFTALGVIMDGIVNLDFKKVANGVLQLGTGVEDVIGKVGRLAQEVTGKVNEAITQANKLAALQRKIDEDDRAALVERARVSLEVAKLREKAISEEGDERRKTIEQAIKLEKSLSDAEVDRAQTKLEQARLELEANGADKEAKMKVAEAEAAVINAQAERYQATLRFQKEIERLNDEDRKKREDQILADQKFDQDMDEKAWQATLASLARDKAAYDKHLADKKKADEVAAAAKKKTDDTVTLGINNNLNEVLGTQKVNYKAGFELFKKGKLAEVLSSTHTAATNAMASAAAVPMIGFILGPLAYAATYAQGLASYIAIGGINLGGFAKGGKTTMGISGTRIMPHHGIPIKRSNGDNRLVTVMTDEAILTREQQARLGGDAALRRAGVPGFAGGGNLDIAQNMETRVASSASDQSAMVAALENALRNAPPVLVLQDFEAVQSGRDQTASRARVI
jgi:hypothetical protein